ncbi:hypothetical protein BIW11_04470 [Tropilaelaps mercedesae]|uniref:Uncharacterized protein n=1 Tax=Tropilaelaps mercedesae TaxID=418985 RepID=A0A1V9X6M4_9ACAR|nr:hypothetical protein BIW11_04470 [Tropilaelaps mercedesae]
MANGHAGYEQHAHVHDYIGPTRKFSHSSIHLVNESRSTGRVLLCYDFVTTLILAHSAVIEVNMSVRLMLLDVDSVRGAEAVKAASLRSPLPRTDKTDKSTFRLPVACNNTSSFSSAQWMNPSTFSSGQNRLSSWPKVTGPTASTQASSCRELRLPPTHGEGIRRRGGVLTALSTIHTRNALHSWPSSAQALHGTRGTTTAARQRLQAGPTGRPPWGDSTSRHRTCPVARARATRSEPSASRAFALSHTRLTAAPVRHRHTRTQEVQRGRPELLTAAPTERRCHDARIIEQQLLSDPVRRSRSTFFKPADASATPSFGCLAFASVVWNVSRRPSGIDAAEGANPYDDRTLRHISAVEVHGPSRRDDIATEEHGHQARRQGLADDGRSATGICTDGVAVACARTGGRTTGASRTRSIVVEQLDNNSHTNTHKAQVVPLTMVAAGTDRQDLSLRVDI